MLHFNWHFDLIFEIDIRIGIQIQNNKIMIIPMHIPHVISLFSSHSRPHSHITTMIRIQYLFLLFISFQLSLL